MRIRIFGNKGPAAGRGWMFFRGGERTTAGWLGIVLPVMAAEWIFFKCCYPYADFFTDSYSYIQAAANGDWIGYRPIGYSIFLRLVHGISASDTLVVTLQYLLLQGASLGMVLSLRRWCGLRDRTVAVLMAFLVLNPLIPYVCNYISSDALFIGLSLIWLTVLMGLLRAPAGWRLLLQVGLLFVIFNVRYVALFYPAVAVLTVLLARRGWGFAIVGVVSSLGVVVACTLWIKAATKKETGADLFSAFSGWQMANNVLNVYRNIPVDTSGLPSPECQELAGFVQRYFREGVGGTGDADEMQVGSAETKAEPVVTTAYMWIRSSPLHLYMKAYQRRNKLSYFDAWNRVGVVFTQYGYWVARRHPGPFLRYYIWPSAETFLLSDLDVFGVYNEGKMTVDVVAKDWFHYPSTRVKVYSATLQARLMAPMPWVVLGLNIAMVVVAVLFLPSRRMRERTPAYTGSFRLVAAFLLANAAFSIFAAPTVFRYQVLPMIVLFVLVVSGGALVVGARKWWAGERL